MRHVFATPTNLRRVFLSAAVSAVVVAALFATGTAAAQEVPSEEALQRCATTDAYKAFEVEQYNQYMASPAFQKQLKGLQDVRAVLASMDDLGKELAKRPNRLETRGGKKDRKDDRSVRDYISKGLTKLELPTCYENPLTYFLLATYAKDIDAARERLGFQLATPLNLATLPTDEINAYTYPVLDGEQSVVAVNTQLFMFAYQMTKVTMPTLGLRRSGRGVAISVGRPSVDNEVLTNFTMAVQEFLGIVPPSTQPLDQAYDPLLITLVEGVEKFVVAHEYGHVIKGHKSPVGSFRLGAAADATARTTTQIPVLLRSWQQELEADDVGFRLLADSLQNGKATPELRAYTLYGSLFFFRCLEIIEDAKFVLENGRPRASPTLSEKQFVHAYLAGATTKAQEQDYAALLETDHPPTWIRRERITALLDEELTRHPPRADGQDFLRVASGLDRNADLVWAEVAPKLPILFAAQRSLQTPGADPAEALNAAIAGRVGPSADCPVPSEVWAGQSICTAELLRAVNAFASGAASDEELLRLYDAAVQRDWLLLSGAQLEWAKRNLTQPGNRGFALALIAFSGVAEMEPVLASVAGSMPDPADRALLARVQAFVRAHAKATNLEALANADAATFRREMFLASPRRASSSAGPAFASAPSRTPALDRFFAANSGMEMAGPMVGMMAGSLYLRHTDGAALATFADILLEAKRYDAALSFAQAAKARGGLASMVDNTIGNILSAQGKLIEANQHYQASLQAGRLDGWPEVNMGLNYEKLGDNAAAERAFRAGLARKATVRSSGEYARYLNALAWLLVTKFPDDKRRIAEGLALSLESNTLTGFSDANKLDTLAEALFQAGDVRRAIEVAEAAAKAATDPADQAEYRGKAERWKTTAGRKPN